MKKKHFRIGMALSILFATNATAQQQTLKDAYADYFDVGVSLSMDVLKGEKAQKLVIDEFSSITAENCMKPEPLSPTKGTYLFGEADSLINFAQSNGKKIRGHALLWHYQSPDWFFDPTPDGEKPSKEIIFGRLRTYIHDVVGHFKGRVYAWDVVNEAISDKADEYLRVSKWSEHCGEEFIMKAFQYAHEADPNAELYYNDYNVIDPVKRAKIIKLISRIQAQGIPITGLGIQAHWNVAEPTRPQLMETIEQLSVLNIKLHITEMDLRVTTATLGGQLTAEEKEKAVYKFTPKLSKRQADQYEMLFDVFRQYSHIIENVTFWCLSDGNTWLDRRWNNEGKNFPLLFNPELERKEAYYRITNFKK